VVHDTGGKSIFRRVSLADVKREKSLEQNKPGKTDPEKNETENNKFKHRHHDLFLDSFHVKRTFH